MLNIVIPFFDFTESNTNRKNLNLQIESLSKTSEVRVVLIEGIFSKPLPDYSSQVYKHIKVKATSTIWIKENLINIGISNLPKNWKNVCWLDKDIKFLNPNWISEALLKLESCDIIQPWSECIFLNEVNEIQNVDTTFFKKAIGQKNRIVSFCSNQKGDLNTWAHVGHAWCMTRNWYDKIGGLFEGAIIGGGDGLIADCIRQEYNSKIYKIYGNHFNQYCSKFKGVKIGWVNGLITHYHHGDMSNRQYINRLEVLNKHNFNIDSDLEWTTEGVLTITNKDLESDIIKYFKSRNE